jgi:putative transcriptional regulator
MTSELLEATSTSLTGHLLIAMPAMLDPNFHRTVSYICEHSDQGALGLIINRPLDMDFGEVMDQLDLSAARPGISSQPILQGGPVELQRGFVIHQQPMEWDATVAVTDSIFVTTSQDILGAMAAGSGPNKAQLVLGYSGWGPGQLEREITENAWLSVPAEPKLIFEIPFEQRYEESVALLGVDLSSLSSQAGHA